MTIQPIQPYDRSLGRPTYNYWLLSLLNPDNSQVYHMSTSIHFVWGWLPDHKIFLVPDEVSS